MENEVILLQRWKDFCDYYEMATSHIDLMNTDELELSRFVWVEGFEDGATLEEDVTKHFTDEETEEAGIQNCLGKGILNIGRVACTQVDILPVFTFSFLSSSNASAFLSRKIKYKENILTSFLLSDLVKRLKLESRARNYRDETVYREADMERRMVVIVDIECIWEKKDFIRILMSIKSEKPVLENVFRCEIDEGQSKNFSGLYILTFKDKLPEELCEQVRHTKVLYAGLLKDYITSRTKIIKENPIQRKVISRPPVPLVALGFPQSALISENM